MQVLADHTINSLESLNLEMNKKWFKYDRNECMAPLLVLLARQTSLKTLDMNSNELSDAQKDQILKVLTENAPECMFNCN